MIRSKNNKLCLMEKKITASHVGSLTGSVMRHWEIEQFIHSSISIPSGSAASCAPRTDAAADSVASTAPPPLPPTSPPAQISASIPELGAVEVLCVSRALALNVTFHKKEIVKECIRYTSTFRGMHDRIKNQGSCPRLVGRKHAHGNTSGKSSRKKSLKRPVPPYNSWRPL